MAKTKVFVAIPSTNWITDGQPFILRQLEKDYADKIELIYPKDCVRRIFHDYARNMLVEEFLKSDADILWFLDSDITPPEKCLDLITKGPDWKVAGLAYPIFMKPENEEYPQVMFTAYHKYANGFAPATMIPDNGTEWVDGLATGCLFIRREVFSEIIPEKPYFKFTFDPTSGLMREGEDFFLMRKLSEKGIKFYTDYGMVCRHLKTIDLLDVNNYAMSYAKKTVLAFHRTIREELKSKAGSLTHVKQPTALATKWSR